jgi:hypothetical protein
MPQPSERPDMHGRAMDEDVLVGDAADIAACAIAGSTHEAELVDRAKARVAEVRKRRQASRAVRADLALAESELYVLVNAPVSGGRDPTEWLPDELVVMILVRLPCDVLWGRVCERVCRRWARLMESALVQRRKRDGRWAAYEAGVIQPRVLKDRAASGPACAWDLTVGLDGKVFTAWADDTIRVCRSGDDGSFLCTLEGHTAEVHALAAGPDAKVYSGSCDSTVRVWSGDDGTHLQTLEGHTDTARALAVGLDGMKVYSGSYDCTIRVWSSDDGIHLQTLEGHTEVVSALAVGLDGKVYSGSYDCTIRVWSGDDGAHIQTLEGHTDNVVALVAGLNGEVYSGSRDKPFAFGATLTVHFRRQSRGTGMLYLL